MAGKLISLAIAGLMAGSATAAMAQAPADEAAATAGTVSAWPEARSPSAMTDAATENRISVLLAQMTLAQKVGQLIQADISTITPADLAQYPLGSLLAGGNSGPYGDERAGAEQWHRLVGEFRAASMAPRAKGVAIPIIFGIDAVHGHNNLPEATVFPHNIGLGAAHDPDLIRRIGEVTANEIAGSGIEWTFAPTLAVPQDPRWGRTYEGYSSDPDVVESYSRAMVEGLQGVLEPGVTVDARHVAATAKHFLADGGTEGGKDRGDARIAEAELVRVHNAGYPDAIRAGALTVMASFSSWNGAKNHANRHLLTDALKNRMGFGGFVVGDWNGHGEVAGCTNTDCPAALMAGLDMFMAPDSWKGLFETTLRQAQAGEIPMARLDDAVRRILRVKAKLGLLDDPLPARQDYAAIGAPEHLAVAREAVAKSLVLLKNEGGVLPVKPGAKVLVAGEAADSLAMQSGGWTISWQGTDVTDADFRNGQTIWDGIDAAVTESGGSATLSLDGSFAEKPDVAIVVFGEKPYAEFQGDVPTLAYQPAGAKDLELLQALKAQGIKVVSVFLSGRPMFVNREINASDAFVAAWLPGTQGAGVADVLVAKPDGAPARDFTGTLSFAWPDDATSPVTHPLFPLGYGLSYAKGGSVPQLSEDPGIDLTEALNVANFFDGGRAQAPWELSVTDAGGKRIVGPAPQDSPEGAIKTRSVDFAAQEDAKSIRFDAPGLVSIDGPAADLSRQLGNSFVLRLDWRIDQKGDGPVTLGMGNIPLKLDEWLATAPVGEATTLRVPLRCFADLEADFTQIGNAVNLTAPAGFAMTLIGAKVEAVGEDYPCPPAAPLPPTQ